MDVRIMMMWIWVQDVGAVPMAAAKILGSKRANCGGAEVEKQRLGVTRCCVGHCLLAQQRNDFRLLLIGQCFLGIAYLVAARLPPLEIQETIKKQTPPHFQRVFTMRRPGNDAGN